MSNLERHSTIIFDYIKIASSEQNEQAYLVRIEDDIVAVLLPADDGWFLHVGFGPCDREGLIFSSLDAAEDWVRRCFMAVDGAVAPDFSTQRFVRR